MAAESSDQGSDLMAPTAQASELARMLDISGGVLNFPVVCLERLALATKLAVSI